MTQVQITADSLKVFKRHWDMRKDWFGTPLLEITKEERGNLTQLKRAGLLDTFRDEHCDFVSFTDAGEAFGAQLDQPVKVPA